MDDEGPYFLIELEDGRVLYLNGQYLEDYVDPVADTQSPAPFPCTNFTMSRHPTHDTIVDIACAGKPLPVEFSVEELPRGFFDKDRIPEDGDIVENRTYDDLRRLLGR